VGACGPHTPGSTHTLLPDCPCGAVSVVYKVMCILKTGGFIYVL